MKNGIEIFFQNLGDADSIFVRTWENDVATNILIDGGYKKDYPQVKGFLTDRLNETGTSQIDHLVCTHCHDDHAGGLLALAESSDFSISKAWVHDTRSHFQLLTENRKKLMKQAGANNLLQKLLETEARRHELLEALEENHPETEVIEPSVGDRIGPLIILSPSDAFFHEQLFRLDDSDTVKELEARLTENSGSFAQFFEARTASAEKPLGGLVGPVNETSLVLAYCRQVNDKEDVYLFTADAGCDAFNSILETLPTQLQGLKWMQVPHHGSRKNLNEDLIAYFRPKTCMISASGIQKGGVVKHPRIKLVNKLKEYGKVYSMHYSVSGSGWLRQTAGTVLDMKTVPATPLYEKT